MLLVHIAAPQRAVQCPRTPFSLAFEVDSNNTMAVTCPDHYSDGGTGLGHVSPPFLSFPRCSLPISSHQTVMSFLVNPKDLLYSLIFFGEHERTHSLLDRPLAFSIGHTGQAEPV